MIFCFFLSARHTFKRSTERWMFEMVSSVVGLQPACLSCCYSSEILACRVVDTCLWRIFRVFRSWISAPWMMIFHLCLTCLFVSYTNLFLADLEQELLYGGASLMTFSQSGNMVKSH